MIAIDDSAVGMTAKMYNTSLALCALLLLSGCVSVNLGAGKIEKSDVATYTDPVGDYEEFDAPVVDVAWRHKTDSNSIAVMSQCEQGGGFSLDELKKATVAEIESGKVIEERDFELNQRAAKSIVILGSMDGVPSQVKVVFFRKHECIYSLTYVSQPQKFKAHVKSFDDFVQGYKVP